MKKTPKSSKVKMLRTLTAEELRVELARVKAERAAWVDIASRYREQRDEAVDSGRTYARAAAEAEREKVDSEAKLHALTEAFERQTGELKDAQTKLGDAQSKLRVVSTEVEDVWFWQGDGHDEIDDLTCPVVMEAETARKMARALEDVEKIEQVHRIVTEEVRMGPAPSDVPPASTLALNPVAPLPQAKAKAYLMAHIDLASMKVDDARIFSDPCLRWLLIREYEGRSYGDAYAEAVKAVATSPSDGWLRDWIIAHDEEMKSYLGKEVSAVFTAGLKPGPEK